MTAEKTDRPQVKICGLKEESTIYGMKGLPVDLIGFVFAPSKRQVTIEQAARLASAAHSVKMGGGATPRLVGVFVNPSIEVIGRVLSYVPLDIIQLHGQEKPDFCQAVKSRFCSEIWKALPAEDPAHESEAGGEVKGGPARLDAYAGIVSSVLIDTAGGGTGRTFRWELIPSYQERARRLGLRLFVAGGLTPDNVGDLLSRYRPDGLDISSGVETDGAKDIHKIAAFAERVNAQ
jgi:phosphoribosylanthranilate isomerase